MGLVITQICKRTDEVQNLLCELSLKHGGAWIAIPQVFGTVFVFRQYSSPSRIPASVYDLCQPWWMEGDPIGWEGRLIPFSKAVIAREQNKGIGRD